MDFLKAKSEKYSLKSREKMFGLFQISTFKGNPLLRLKRSTAGRISVRVAGEREKEVLALFCFFSEREKKEVKNRRGIALVVINN